MNWSPTLMRSSTDTGGLAPKVGVVAARLRGLRSGRERLPPPPTASAPVVDSTRACSRPPRIRLGSSLRDLRRANTRALLLSCHDRALPELRTVATESSAVVVAQEHHVLGLHRVSPVTQ